MWGICFDDKAMEDGLFQAVVQYKIDNGKALVISPKANYGLYIKRIYGRRDNRDSLAFQS